jgi:hypothetical protein
MPGRTHSYISILSVMIYIGWPGLFALPEPANLGSVAAVNLRRNI